MSSPRGLLVAVVAATIGVGLPARGDDLITPADTARVSVRSDGSQADGYSVSSSISANGRYVAFDTTARLVPEDTNDNWDVYVRDLLSNKTELISVNPRGRAGNGDSTGPKVSDDGRFVAYSSWATDLLAMHPFDAPGAIASDSDFVYVADAGSNTISVYFGVNNTPIRDIDDGQPVVIEVGQNPSAIVASFDRIVVANAGSNTLSQVSGGTWEVEHTVGVGQTPTGMALFAPDEFGEPNLYVANSGSDSVSVIGLGSFLPALDDAGEPLTIGVGQQPSGIAASQDTGLVYVANAGSDSVSVIDTASNAVVAIIPVGRQPSAVAVHPQAGRAYVTNAGSDSVSAIDVGTNAVTTTIPVDRGPTAVVPLRLSSFDSEFGDFGYGDTVYVANAESNTISLLDVPADELLRDAEGHPVRLNEVDRNHSADVFVRDRTSGNPSEQKTTVMVSVGTRGEQANDDSFASSISAPSNSSSDAWAVAFYSLASNLEPGDTNGVFDVFLRDQGFSITYPITLGSRAVPGFRGGFWPSVGSRIEFGDGAIGFHIAYYELIDGVFDLAITVVCRVTDPKHPESCEGVDSGGMEPINDVLSTASEVLRDEGIPLPADPLEGTAGGLLDPVLAERSSPLSSGFVSIPQTLVAFVSDASDLTPGDVNGRLDVFVLDRSTGAVELASASSTGAQGNDHSWGPALSPDGRYIAFSSYASNLVPGDDNRTADVFVRDLLTRTTARVSLTPSGNQGNDHSIDSSISRDGKRVSFMSFATNLVPGDANASPDVFVRTVPCLALTCVPG